LSFVFNFVRNRQYATDKCCCYSTFCRKIPSIARLVSSPDDGDIDGSLPSTVLHLAPTTSTISPPASNRNTQIQLETTLQQQPEGDRNTTIAIDIELTTVGTPPKQNEQKKITENGFLVSIDEIVEIEQNASEMDRNHLGSRSCNSLPVEFRGCDNDNNHKLELQDYLSQSDNTNLNPRLNVNDHKHIQIPTDNGHINVVDHNKSNSTPVSLLGKRKFNLHRPAELPNINTKIALNDSKIQYNNNPESHSRTRTRTNTNRSQIKPNKALVLLGFTPTTMPSPELYAPSVTPSVNGDNEDDMDFDDGTVICYDDGTASNELPGSKLRLEVIESDAPISPEKENVNPNTTTVDDRDYSNRHNTKTMKASGRKQPRSYSDATANSRSSGLKNRYKINTPQSMNQMRKYDNNSTSNNQSHLKLNMFDSTFDTDIIDESMDFDAKNLELKSQIYHKTAPSSPRMGQKTQQQQAQASKAFDDSITVRNEHGIKNTPQTQPLPMANYLPKPMSQLALPTSSNSRSNTNNMVRSSSNPLLMRNNTSEDISYDLSFIDDEPTPNDNYNNRLFVQNKLPLSKLNSVPPPKSRNNSFVISRQRTNSSHQKAQSGNDMQQFAPFTLVDALKSVQNQRKAGKSGSSKKKRGTRHKRAKNRSRNRMEAHTPNESVVSVLNLFVAQGFGSKMSVNSLQQINQLTRTPNESMQISNRNLFNVSMQI